MKKTKTSRGFTIVEVLVIVAVIGVLAAVSIFGFRSWRQSIANSQTKSDLLQLSSAMDSQKNFSDAGYPLTGTPTTFKASEGTTITFVWRDGTRFCAQAVNDKYPSTVFYVDSTQGKEAKTGNCPASPIQNATPLTNPTLALDSSSANAVVVSWGNVNGANSYTVRYGTSSPTTSASCSNSPCTISSLSSNTTYKMNVTATNTSGSAASTTIDALTRPSTPAAPAATYATVIKSGSKTYNLTGTGGTCSQGTREWQFASVQAGYEPSEGGNLSGWQSGNTYSFSQITNGFQGPVPLEFYVITRCTNASGSTQYSSYVQAT